MHYTKKFNASVMCSEMLLMMCFFCFAPRLYVRANVFPWNAPRNSFSCDKHTDTLESVHEAVSYVGAHSVRYLVI